MDAKERDAAVLEEKKITETFECEVRSVADKSRVLRFIGTTPSRDRYGDVISVSGWSLKAYRKNPTVLWNHRHDIPPIGRTVKITKDGDKLLFDVEFAPAHVHELAEQVYQLCKLGFLKACSVGFIPLKSKPLEVDEEELKAAPDLKPGRLYEKCELLELSIVSVPANREALLVEMEKGLAVPEELRREVEGVVRRDIVTELQDYNAMDMSDNMPEEIETEEKGAIPYSVHGDGPKAPENAPWDAAREVKKATGDAKRLRKMHAWFQTGEDPTLRRNYKLPHHKGDGAQPVVWRGVAAAMAALLGARGGVKIPEADKKGVYNHLARHYKQFDKEPPELRDYDEAELKEIFAEVWDDIPETRDAGDMVLERPGWDDSPDYTEIRYRIRDPEDFEPDSFRRIPIKKSKPRVFAVAGRLKGEKTMTLQSLRFPKGDGWTLDKAKKWVEDHPDIVKAIGAEMLEDVSAKAESAEPSGESADTRSTGTVPEAKTDTAESKNVPELKQEIEMEEKEMEKLLEKIDQISGNFTQLVDKIAEIEKKVDAVQSRQERLVGPPDGGADSAEPKNREFKPRRKSQAEMPPEDEFSFVRLALALNNRDWKLAEYEKYAIEETSKKRTLTFGTGSAGGYWVAAEFLPEQFIENLYANIVVRKAGARVLTFKGAPAKIPKASGSATAYWVSEGGSITASDMTAAQLELSPKICAGRTSISNLLLETSAAAAEQIVRQDLAQVIAEAVDLAALRGTGSGGQPTGIANTSNINTVTFGDGTNGGALSLDKLIDMVYEVEKDNALKGTPVWIVHPRTVRDLRKLKDSQNRPLVDPDPTASSKGMLYGFPIYTTTQIPIDLTVGSNEDCTEIYFGNIEDLIIGEWGTVRIDVNPQGPSWSNDAVDIKVVYYVDIGVRHAESFCLANDVTVVS